MTPLLTPRLVLREFASEDWHAVYRINMDPEAKRFIPSDILSEDEAKENVQWCIEQAREEPRVFYDLAIALPEMAEKTDEVFGWCRLAHRFDEVRQGEIAYQLRRDFWRQGLATEVAARLLAFGFSELNLHRVFATARPANTASWRVLERVGMRREGHLVRHRWMKGTWLDSYLYAILEDEWRALS